MESLAMGLFPQKVRTVGRVAQPLELEFVRELGPADLEALALPRPKPLQVQPLQRYRDSHHRIAKLLASGYSHVQTADVTGYSLSRIAVLATDPAFCELIDHYRSRQADTESQIAERIAVVAADLLGELQDRLTDKAEEFSNNELIEAFKTMADRSGNGPTSKSQNLNVNLVLADRLSEARRRSGLSQRQIEDQA